MLYVFYGTDREEARKAMHKKMASVSKARVVRVTDAHVTSDLREALGGKGMFNEEKVVVCEDVCANEEMRGVLTALLPTLKGAREPFFIFEEKPDAALLRMLKAHAHEIFSFDIKKADARDGEIFALAYALKKKDKKALWIGYQRELLKGTAPEAIHGVLFWGAKDMVLKMRGAVEVARAKYLLAELAELPHEARRTGVDLEYALEHFVLSGT